MSLSPSNRIVAGEFGVNRKAPGATRYFKDLIQIFDEEGLHWAFYSWREDEWDAMDYELGTGNPGADYWKATGQGKEPDYRRYKSGFMETLRESLKKS